jgi:hypothetical protein
MLVFGPDLGAVVEVEVGVVSLWGSGLVSKGTEPT